MMELLCKQHIMILIAVSISCCFIGSQATTIFPSGMALVCNGDQIELICNITGNILVWSFFTIDDETGVDKEYARRGIRADAPRESQTFNLTRLNSTVITFSRISAQDSSVLTSRVFISAVSDILNGTLVTCKDEASEAMDSTTIITSISQSQDRFEVSVSELFERYTVTVTLQWTQDSPLVSQYHINVIPPLPVMFNGNGSAVLAMSFSIPYNVNVIAENLCGENVTIFTHSFNFTSCGNPVADVTDENVRLVSGYDEPAVNGSVVSIMCLPGMEQKNSTCMDNGVWIPQLRCTGDNTQENIGLSIILGSSFGVIACLVIITAIILTLAYVNIRGSKEVDMRENRVNGDEEVHTTSDDHNNSKIATDCIVYADIGPSSFVHLSHQRPCTPAIDDETVEYAQIKHNPKHTEKSSMSQKKQPVVKESLTESESRPDKLAVNLDNLLIQLRPQVASKWYQFGEAAGIDKETLDRFINQCSPEDCIMEMLDYWLRKCVKQPTWLDVARILNMIELSQLAMEIENIYITGKFPVEVDKDWIPQTQVVECSGSESASTDSPPPPIPPKTLESKEAPNQLDRDSTPALPPKPINMCGIVTGIPLR